MVRVTARHSDSTLSASEAATASINRGDATGALWLLKPVAPGDRIMVSILACAGESPATEANLPNIAGKIAAGVVAKTA